MAAPGVANMNVKCWLRYQYVDFDPNEEFILTSIANGPYGSTIAVLQDDGNAFLKVIGVLDKRDAERLNHLARPQLQGNFRPRGGPRVGSRFAPDVVSVSLSPFSPQYQNTYPPNYGHVAGPHGGRAYITLRIVYHT